MSENQNTVSYREVSQTLGTKLIKLYAAKIFPRQGKVFADMLFQTGVEAGTYITSLEDVDDRGLKTEIASKAMVKLNQMAYILSIMREAGYYSAEQTSDLSEYIKGLIRAMRELLTAAFAVQRPEGVRAIPVPMPVTVPIAAPQPKPMLKPVPKPAVKSAAEAKPAAPKPEQPFDPDGFSEPV